MSACTIIDNDLRNLPDTPGFKEVEHVETDQYTLDYQYQPTTIVVDEQMARYISTVDYENEVLYMYDYTPDDLLPGEGRVLVSTIYDNVMYGLRHRVEQITRESGHYALKLQQATLDAAYKHLHLEANFETDSASFDEARYVVNDMDESDPRALTRAPETFTYGEWHQFSLVDKLNAMSALLGIGVVPNHVKFDTGAIRKGGVKGYVDIEGDIIIRWRPIIEGHALIDLDSRQVDMDVRVGTDCETQFCISGDVGVNIDILDMFGIKDALSVKEPVVPIISLWLTGGFTLELDMNVGGTITKTFHRRMYVDLGARNNIEGKDDGVSVSKGGSDEVKDFKPKDSWSDPWTGSPTFEVSLMGGSEIKVLIGNPVKWPQAGIAFSGLIGPKLKTYYEGGKDNDSYNHMLKAGVAVKASGRFYFDLFEGITFDWDFVKALANALGSSDGAEVMIPALSVNRRFYPNMENMSITCQNPAASESPRFDMSFNVTNRGFYCSLESDVYPYFIVYEKGKDEALLEYDPQKKVSPIGSGTSFSDNFTWKGFGDGVLKRDTKYDLEVIMMTKPKYGQPDILWRRRTTFEAAWQPTMRCHGSFTTAQWQWLPANEEATAAGGYEHYDWTLRTVVSFNETMPIQSWGFEVGGKTFIVEGPPPTNGTSMTIPVRWKIKNSKRSTRVIAFLPFIYALNPATGYVERFAQEHFLADLEWDDNWVLKEVEDEPRTVNGLDYLVTGYDWDVDFVVPEQVNIDSQGTLSARRYQPVLTQPDTTQTIEFTIDLDE